MPLSNVPFGVLPTTRWMITTAPPEAPLLMPLAIVEAGMASPDRTGAGGVVAGATTGVTAGVSTGVTTGVATTSHA